MESTQSDDEVKVYRSSVIVFGICFLSFPFLGIGISSFIGALGFPQYGEHAFWLSVIPFVLLFVVLTRRPALRINPHGLTLGRRVIPWLDITGFYIRSQKPFKAIRSGRLATDIVMSFALEHTKEEAKYESWIGINHMSGEQIKVSTNLFNISSPTLWTMLQKFASDKDFVEMEGKDFNPNTVRVVAIIFLLVVVLISIGILF